MSNTWALEFVGGPLDGRTDIETPVNCFQWLYPSTVSSLSVATPPEDVSLCAPELRYHVYTRGQRRKCGPEWDANGNGYWQNLVSEVWVYHEKKGTP